MDGDASPPSIGGLRGTTIRVGQRIAGGHVHQDEGVEGDEEPARFQILDRLHDRGVGGRTAIRGAAIAAAYQIGILAPQPRDAPGDRIRVLGRNFHSRQQPT